MPEGYVNLYRKITEWGWYKDINTCHLFVHIILTANYKDRNVMGVKVNRGQLMTTVSSLAFETGLSVKNVRTALTKLKLDGEISVKTANRYSLVTVEKYSLYQGEWETSANKRQTNGNQTANKRQTNGKQMANERQSNGNREGGNDIYNNDICNSTNDIIYINNKEKKKELKKEIYKERKTRFTKPTLEEVRDYIRDRGYHVDAEEWLAHYESKDWMIGKDRMTDWQAAVRTWEIRWKKEHPHSNTEDQDGMVGGFKRLL